MTRYVVHHIPPGYEQFFRSIEVGDVIEVETFPETFPNAPPHSRMEGAQHVKGIHPNIVWLLGEMMREHAGSLQPAEVAS